jgi:glucose-6-phosphate isomerase
VTSVVGLFPAALAGIDCHGLLDGASRMDELTRERRMTSNPAALLAAAWYVCGEGRGDKDMVVLPYKDRLRLLAPYLQQLVMESLGKRDDLDGLRVHQGLTVYGNKGSTDQHAYVQQLLDGPDNFFVTFVEVLRDRDGAGIEVEPEVSSGDFLSGFLHGTRRALSDRGRESLLLTLDRLDAASLGAVIALYERAVGLYASLINVNAYHQPGVESGKRAASEYLERMLTVRAWLRAHPGPHDVAAVAAGIDVEDLDGVLRVLRHLAANGRHGIHSQLSAGQPLWAATFAALG